jgi:hypothetical protein
MGIEIRVEQLGSMMCHHISINKEKIFSEWRRAHLPIIKVVGRGPQINNKGRKRKAQSIFCLLPYNTPGPTPADWCEIIVFISGNWRYVLYIYIYIYKYIKSRGVFLNWSEQ